MYITKNKNNNQSGFVMVVALIIVFSAVAVSVYFYLKQPTSNESENSRSVVQRFMATPTPTPTPVPFKELTIPYLRDREYESSLGELRQISSNGSYTSYTTSYDSDGLQVNGLLTIPSGEAPSGETCPTEASCEGGWPAIIFVHGYIPPTLYETTENYASYVDYFARRGFVVFKIDLRGHDDSDGIASGAYYSGDYIIDTLNAKAALADSELVNGDRIGLWGHSMAGNVTFRSFVADQNIKALVIWAGAVYTYADFADYRIQDTSYRPPEDDSERRRKREELFDAHGSFDPASEYWQMVVPTNYLDGVAGAIQIHHATNDSVVSVDYSRNLLDVISGSGINTTLFEYPSGGHNITGGSFTQAMQRSVEFFEEEL